ncbi:ferredoxin [Paucimonas lemoignei]|uniref:Ferredoxin n=1 Tax=Paucimonas lemoignei TaxID=29443 RepID=A0A4R3HTE9_PAULE|nr:2Fe-2S iron-sulfur cluster-binding protein [Paucimonas lemoignei]TCS36322.1 ferredoxin [Paucimonas lemoignei]
MTTPPHRYQVVVLPGGQSFEAQAEQSLLKSLDEAGIYWPRSCRNGTCRTCLGKLLEGQVRYEVDWPGLSAEEKQAGCILPCVARPLSNLVLLDPLAD